MPRLPFWPLASTTRFILHAMLAVLAAWLWMLGSPALAAPAPPEPPAPHLEARRGDAALDVGSEALVLKAVHADVHITGVVAEVTVLQQYRYDGSQAIDAAYVWAGLPHAAMQALTVRVGGRELVVRMQGKPRPRIEVVPVRRPASGRSLPQAPRPEVLCEVSGIQPGDEVQVALRYTEPVVATDGLYRFVLAAGAQARASAAFDLQLHLAAPLPVNTVDSPSHPIEVSGEDASHVDVTLADEGARALRPFVLEYRLGGEQATTGLMLYRGDQENFFLALAAPPQVVEPSQVLARDLMLVVGVSVSPRGEALETARRALRELVGSLRPSDRFGLMDFAGRSLAFDDALTPATQAHMQRAFKAINRLSVGSGTDFMPALRRIAALPRDPDVSRSVILVTDGRVAVGSEVLPRVRSVLGRAGVHVVGVGPAVNQPLLEGLARVGGTEPFMVDHPGAAAVQVERLRRQIEAPVLTQLNLRFVGMEVSDVEAAQLPDVMAGRPGWVIGKWRAAADAPPGLMVVEGRAAAGPHREWVPLPAPDPHAGALAQHWAQRRVQQLVDQEALEGGHAHRDEITALGLKYRLATPYTAWVAQDVRAPWRQPLRMRQRGSRSPTAPRSCARSGPVCPDWAPGRCWVQPVC